jgi:hypothetical protein
VGGVSEVGSEEVTSVVGSGMYRRKIVKKLNRGDERRKSKRADAMGGNKYL